MIARSSIVALAALAALLSGARSAEAQRGRKVAARASAKAPARQAEKPQKKEAPPAPPPKEEADAEAPPPPSALRGPMRIDFDDRLVQGQTNKLGAVYLYQRKDPAQPSLLERKKSFREEIARDLVE
jgi:hypothetical protein